MAPTPRATNVIEKDDTLLAGSCPASEGGSALEAIDPDPVGGPPPGETPRSMAPVDELRPVGASPGQPEGDGGPLPGGGRGEPRPSEAEARGRRPLVTRAGSGAQPQEGQDDCVEAVPGDAPPETQGRGPGGGGGVSPPHWATTPETCGDVQSPGEHPALGQSCNLRVVSRHVDTLNLTYALAVTHRGVLGLLERWLDRVKEVVDLDGIEFAAKSSKGATSLWLQNDDARVLINPFDVHKRPVKIELSAAYLMRHCLREALQLAERIANALGRIRERRVTRADWAVDLAGSYIAESDPVATLVQRAARKAGLSRITPTDEFNADDDVTPESGVREFRQGNDTKLTGVTVGMGGAISFRMYDKRRELSLASRAHKREATEALWRSQGWDGKASVIRHEWQLRGVVLDELGIRDPDALIAKLDKVYQYCVRWCRIVVPGSASRMKRCTIDPRWEVLQGVVFVHASAPAARSRRRGGVRPVMVVTGAMSALAGIGMLHRFVAQVEDADVSRDSLREELVGLQIDVVDEFLDEQLQEQTPAQLRSSLVARATVVRARFGSVDDSPPVETEAVA